MAKARKREVWFIFNGVTMRIARSAGTSADKLTALWDYKFRVQAERWRHSAAGRLYAQERAAELARRQDAVASAIAILPGLLWLEDDGKMNRVIDWLASFVKDADHCGIDWNRAANVRDGGMEWIALCLESAGYHESDLVGYPEDCFTTRELVGRWIIGQAIHALRLGMPPHPGLTTRFAAQYFALPAQRES